MPADHLAHFVIDAIESLDLRAVRVNIRGTGEAQYPSTMLLGLPSNYLTAGGNSNTSTESNSGRPPRLPLPEAT